MIIEFVLQSIFLLIILSYYALILIKPKKPEQLGPSSLTILIPARNEERFIKSCIKSVLGAKFNGKKEVIVIDDASTDKTYEIGKSFPVKVIKNKTHLGKSKSMNKAIRAANGEFIAVVDADTIIDSDALINAMDYFSDPSVSAITTVVKVKNRLTLLGVWLHIEQLYNSLLRGLFTNINANISTPGPLSLFRKKTIVSVGGFDTEGFSEDIDIAIKILRMGLKIKFSENSYAYTNMPVSIRGFFKQRTRFARGWVNILRRNLKISNKLVDLYSLPLALFAYLQAVIMSLIVIYNVGSGYYLYFLSQGVIFDMNVVTFLIGWFSIYGLINWLYSIAISGSIDVFTFIALLSSLLSYPLYIISILRYDKKIGILHIIPILFMFPFWFLIMLIYLFNLTELFRSSQKNIWEKCN